MRMGIRWLSGILAGVLAIAGLSACSGMKEAAQEEKPLTIYLWDADQMQLLIPYLHEQLPDKDLEIIGGCNDTDLYSYLRENGELPDIITVRRYSGTDAKDLQPYLLDLGAYDVVSAYYSYALQYYKNEDGSINWLPVCGIPQTIIANKTLFDQYGLALPESYEDYVDVCQAFYDHGIKPYAMDLANDWSGHEAIQAGGIGEFTSLAGIAWRNEAESAQGDIPFDDAMWKRIFTETENFLRDSHFTEEDLSYGIAEAQQLFVEGKAAMFHGTQGNMQECQKYMDAELVRIPYFSQTSGEGFVYMNPSLNVALNKELEEDSERLETAMQVLDCMISEEGQKLIGYGGGAVSFNPGISLAAEGMEGLETEIENNAYYIRYSGQKSFVASYEAVQGLLTGKMDVDTAYETFRQVMNKKEDTPEVAAHFDQGYSLSLNAKGGRDAASSILTTVREALDAELALSSYYHFSSSIYAGDCTGKRVKMMVAYTPGMYRENLSGAEIKALAAACLTGNAGSFQPLRRYELPIASGMRLVINEKDGFTLEDILVDGKPIDEEKQYAILLVDAVGEVLQNLYPEGGYGTLTESNLSSAWVDAVEKGRQPAEPEDYIEIRK